MIPKTKTKKIAPAEDSTAQQRASGHELVRNGSQWVLSPIAEAISSKPLPSIVPALEKGIAIIGYLNAKAPRPASLHELSTNLEITKSHCYSILKTLIHFEWVQFNEESKLYGLQAGILASASSLLNSPLINSIRPVLTDLVERIRLPCLLSQPMADGSYVAVDRFNCQHIMEVSFPVGHRFPRDACAQMRAFLAWQSEGQIDQWLAEGKPKQYTTRTTTAEAEFRAEIKATRERGYARSIGEVNDGLMALSLPIFDREGRVAFLVTCFSLIYSLEAHETEVATAMIQAVADIHRHTLARLPPSF